MKREFRGIGQQRSKIGRGAHSLKIAPRAHSPKVVLQAFLQSGDEPDHTKFSGNVHLKHSMNVKLIFGEMDLKFHTGYGFRQWKFF